MHIQEIHLSEFLELRQIILWLYSRVMHQYPKIIAALNARDYVRRQSFMQFIISRAEYFGEEP